MADKTPVVIIPAANSFSPKLPAKHRFEYRTEVHTEADTITLTVSVVKHNLFAKLFPQNNKAIKSLSCEMPRDHPVQDAAHAMEIALKEELFSNK